MEDTTVQESTPRFDELGLDPRLVVATAALGFKIPTAIQAGAIPMALTGKDLVGAARTGSGKTAAFALPILHDLLTRGVCAETRRPQALVLAPTRELALQIEKTFTSLSTETPMRTTTVVGGMPMNPQIDALKAGVEVLVGTPGRLIDHMERRTVDLRDVRTFILDEADRMLDMGFEEQLNTIMRAIPKERQTMLFSATIQGATARLFRTSVKDPLVIDVTGDIEEIPDVDLKWVELLETDKRARLTELIVEEEGTMLIFLRTKQRTHMVNLSLLGEGYDTAEIHSGLDQRQRSRALERFRDGRVRILVATDVAARGIDVEAIGHVVNYDMPYAPEDFVHRIGRTARAGLKGRATNFVTVGDRETVKQILRYIDDRSPMVEEEKPKAPTYGRRMRRDPKARRGSPKQGKRLF
jgi:ATP-dependent RNA helicase RhlE